MEQKTAGMSFNPIISANTPVEAIEKMGVTIGSGVHRCNRCYRNVAIINPSKICLFCVKELVLMADDKTNRLKQPEEKLTRWKQGLWP